MNIYTFRAEIPSDYDNVRNLLVYMGVNQFTEHNSIFTFTSKLTGEEIYTMMRLLCNVHEDFNDLHRCIDTLKPGYYPNNEWFISHAIMNQPKVQPFTGMYSVGERVKITGDYFEGETGIIMECSWAGAAVKTKTYSIPLFFRYSDMEPERR